MKAPRIRLRSTLILIALIALLLAGVAAMLRRPGRPHSAVYAGFDPVAVLGSRPGYSVRGVEGWNVFNPVHGYAYKEWRGVVTAPNDPSFHRAVQACIEGYLNKLTRGQFTTETPFPYENWPPGASQPARMPSHLAIRFNDREWHGDLHVWLFPDSSGSSFGYAIFLCEERLK